MYAALSIETLMPTSADSLRLYIIPIKQLGEEFWF